MNNFLQGLMYFIKGVGSILDIGGTSHPTIDDLPSIEDGIEEDKKAIRSDWEKIIGKW